jgi:hypothetical protein
MLTFMDMVTSNNVLACMQLAGLCENVFNLANGNGNGNGSGRQSPTCSPTSTISAVSKLVQEHSEANGKLTTVTQRLEEV